ncbi:hypothetical protein ARALYDRAFT_495816 [Arabidopsis lyrata subsp. lyrata]|uniref:EF-hand domain-containing protein n=1 Tax=Arabidopsis lyrata subsp. lyrata TaxID=81972 RepID=D7MMS6_ARALL|nr:hypothetical protein ARALYDRAFT_495816 [Arabidopsis lyrata subsp. lyrata]
MGNGNSREAKESRRSKLRQKLQKFRIHRRHLRCSRNSAGMVIQRAVSAEDFSGIALLTLRTSGSLVFLSVNRLLELKSQILQRSQFGTQRRSFCWRKMDQVLLGSLYLRFLLSIFLSLVLNHDITSRLSRNKIIGYCELDIFDFVVQEPESACKSFDLLDPTSSNVVGTIFLSCSIEDPVETERRFAKRILSIVDYNQDGQLSFSEFSDLIKAFGNLVAANKKEELFKAADLNGDGVVTIDELAALLALQQEQEPIINNCPVCGEALQLSDKLNAMIHMTLCFDEGTGNQVMTGGFLTDRQASYGWMFKLSEWTHLSTYDVGLNTGSSASYIVVIDRKSKRLVEELIDSKIVLSMRAIYQSKIGFRLMDQGAKEILQRLSEKQGKKMSSVESAQKIPCFLEFFKAFEIFCLLLDQINMAEVKYSLQHFKTFNEFFIRELKPGARPIACMKRDDVAVCAADCRVMAFQSVEDSTRFWIKRTLKADKLQHILKFLPPWEECESKMPSLMDLWLEHYIVLDYHRFHVPVSGVIEKFAFVAIGATMVGSINFVRKEGEHVKKGDEVSSFDFSQETLEAWLFFVWWKHDMIYSLFFKNQSELTTLFSLNTFLQDSIRIDEDLLVNSGRSLETLVRVGMQLGVSPRTFARST